MKNPTNYCNRKSHDFKTFLPEESDELDCHVGVIQVTLSLTHVPELFNTEILAPLEVFKNNLFYHILEDF